MPQLISDCNSANVHHIAEKRRMRLYRQIKGAEVDACKEVVEEVKK
jgi:hypothetical protein